MMHKEILLIITIIRKDLFTDLLKGKFWVSIIPMIITHE